MTDVITQQQPPVSAVAKAAVETNTRKNTNLRPNTRKNTRKNTRLNTRPNNKSKIRFSRKVLNLEQNNVNNKDDRVVKCVVCKSTAFKVKATKFPTGSKMRQWFFGNLGEIFEDQVNALICQNCGYCMWFTKNAPLM